MRYRVIYALPTLHLRYACATALLSLSITFRSPYRLHTSKTRKNLSERFWRSTLTNHERQQLLESVKMSHYALTLAIAGIQTRKPRREILLVLYRLQDVLVIMQKRLDHAIKNQAILIGVPADETNQIFREYQPCLEDEYPSCNGKLCEECDQAFLENPEAWLNEVHRAREFIRRTPHEPRVRT